MSSAFVFRESSETSSSRALAMQSIKAEGLQAPSLPVLEDIIRFALRATDMFYAVALREPDEEQLREFFVNCIISAVNRPAGVSDAAAE